MDFITQWLDTNLMPLLVLTGTTICAALLIVLLVWLIGIIFSLCHWGATRRLAFLRIVADRQVLQLQMKKRSQDTDRLADEIKALQAAASNAARRESDLRRLLTAQEENLTTRDQRGAKLESDIQDLRDGLEEQEEAAAAVQRENASLEKEVAVLANSLGKAREEVTNHEQLISMLEAQLGSQRKASDMANAGMEDLRRELTQSRERNRSLSEQNELYKRINLQTVPT